MGFFNKITGSGPRVDEPPREYEELDIGEIEFQEPSRFKVYISEIGSQAEVMAIKDAVHDGNMVIADITRLGTSDAMMKRVTGELQEVVREVGGDIIQKGDDQIIVTPRGVAINRDKLRR